MVYKKAFFDLQLHFARRVRELTGLPLTQILLEYTNLYVRFGLGREFQPAHPIWQEYIAGLQQTGDIRDWTYRFYLSRAGEITEPATMATFGCFSYALSGDGCIRLHFQNADMGEDSPLSSIRLPQRRSDLTSLVGHAKKRLPPNTQVLGVSWLYNIEAYRRLFPQSYIATASVLSNRFRYMPLWGQFLDRYGSVRESPKHQLFERLDSLTTLEHLNECFPLQVLTVTAPLQDFYEFYGI